MAVTLITGSSTGIGLATALAMGRAGHEVYATMRNPGRSPELQERAAQEGLPIRILALDVNDDDSVAGAVGQMLAERKRIDVLVNNAGIGQFGSVEEMPLAEFRGMMETNFFGALRCIKAVLPHMRAQRSGCIINVTSGAGRVAAAPEAGYAASKFALEAASQALAQEVKAFNIRVVIVEPGAILTPIFSKLRPLPADSPYPQGRRILALFAAILSQPVLPEMVGERIREVVESQSWQFHLGVGPGAREFVEWRKSLSDEEWVELGAIQDDEEWYARVERDFGINARPWASAVFHERYVEH